MLKRLGRSAPVQALIAFLVAGYIRFVHRTTRWRHAGFEPALAFEAERRPYIVCCWHGRMLLICCVRPRTMAIHALASGHRDGRFVGRVMARFGVGTISGSTGRGGHGAIQASRAALAGGSGVVITPDGPRGPAMQAAPGSIRLARLSGATIIPVSYATRRRLFLKTWDRFMVPLPFGTGAFVCGAPMRVLDSADEEGARRQLEDALNAAGRKADALAAGVD
jgi:lysophospholipid acyltransferase (LPLAT)-like uncharacterized protein